MIVKICVWGLENYVECEKLKHRFLVCQDAVFPTPEFLTLFIDDQIRILLRHARNGDDDIFRLSTGLLGLASKKEGSGSDVLFREVSNLPLSLSVLRG